VSTQPAQPDDSAVNFLASTPGTYNVGVRVDGAFPSCPDAIEPFNAEAPGANMVQYRLRVLPGTAAPPQERLVLVKGGASASLDEVPVDPGVLATGEIKAGTTGVPAYLRFIPLGTPDAYVEAFTTQTGAYSARVLNTIHDVLVVPTIPGYPPQLVRGWSPAVVAAQVTAGTAIAGVVRVGGAPIAGAKVQITIGGIPSTLATTAGDGTFSVRSIATAGVPATVDVTPPPATGLPRITATGTFTLGTSMQVTFAAQTLRDLAGTTVRRGGTAVGGAQLAVVGTLPAAATITAGATVDADGIVRLAATANGSGQLPTLLAPAAQLAAAITVAPGDVALTPIDLRTTVPTSITAAPMQEVFTTLKHGADPLPGAVLDVVPAGALALAGMPGVRAVAEANGVVSVPLAPGASYELRPADPRGRAAPIPAVTVTTGSVAATYTLAPAVRISGVLELAGSSNPLGGAGVQILCTDCSGVARSRPLGETATTGAGAFDVAVPDPGTM